MFEDMCNLHILCLILQYWKKSHLCDNISFPLLLHWPICINQVCLLYLEVRTGLILTTHSHNPGQTWLRRAGDIVVVIIVFRREPRDGKRWHVALRAVFAPGDRDLLDGPGDCVGRGGDVLVQVVLGCHVLLLALRGRDLHRRDGRHETAGAACANLGPAEEERVQVVLQAAVIQALALQVTLRKLLAFRHSRGWQPRPNSEGLDLPHNAIRHYWSESRWEHEMWWSPNGNRDGVGRGLKKKERKKEVCHIPYTLHTTQLVQSLFNGQVGERAEQKVEGAAQFSTFLCMLRMHSTQPRTASLDSWDRMRSQTCRSAVPRWAAAEERFLLRNCATEPASLLLRSLITRDRSKMNTAGMLPGLCCERKRKGNWKKGRVGGEGSERGWSHLALSRALSLSLSLSLSLPLSDSVEGAVKHCCQNFPSEPEQKICPDKRPVMESEGETSVRPLQSQLIRLYEVISSAQNKLSLSHAHTHTHTNTPTHTHTHTHTQAH